MTTFTALASSVTLPGKLPPARVGVPRPYPAYVILIHGVNDVGEAYPHQEQGLCEGLNDRLNRGDLLPSKYFVPSREELKASPDLKGYLDNPELNLFRRTPKPDVKSPVIPFYWGFREEWDKINTNEKHGQWLDHHGNRIDKDGSKNGGPFANATSTLPDMWGDGFNNKILGFISLNSIAGEPTHPLVPGGNRRYMVLAAKRLAALIKSIRKRQPNAVIDIVAHSQGCLVSLAAHAFLAKEGGTAVDCLIMNNPPFSLEEPFVERFSQVGAAQQSTHARVTTLKNIVAWMTQAPATSPAFQTLLNPQKNELLTGLKPGTLTHPKTLQEITFTDRDNRGQIFLYFCPDDLTVGLASVQGIGWQGVPEKKSYVVGTGAQEHPVFSTLGDRFHQRVWTKRERKGKPVVLVGDQDQATYTLREKKEAFWAWAMNHKLRSTPDEGSTRPIKAPKIPIPWKPVLTFGETTSGFLEVSAIDASVAITNGGQEETRDLKDGKLKKLHQHAEIVDPRTDQERWMDTREDGDDSAACETVAKHLNAGKDPMDEIQVLQAQTMSNGKLKITYEESFREAQGRWALSEFDLNSYHSSIVSNPEHSRRVTAYDLAIGSVRASEKEEHSKWMAENDAFLNYLRKIADWRQKTDAFNKSMETPEFAPFYGQESGEHKQLLTATAAYYTKGNLPSPLQGNGEVKDAEWAIPLLIKQETVGEVATRLAKANSRHR
jgi:pimeloyl-ACP methyl ester carboxylesterase